MSTSNPIDAGHPADTVIHLAAKADAYLQKLCLEIPNRRVGGPGNRTATDFFAGVVASFGFETASSWFDCIDWRAEGARLTAGRVSFEASVSPYSPGCRVRAPLVVATTIEALEAIDAAGKVLLLREAIAQEQLMPKNFPFYNPEQHQRIIHLLETKQPLAIAAATARNPELAGGIYPFPLIEDGDFDIPSVYMTEEEGERLAGYAGREVALAIEAERIPATGCNVVARKARRSGRRVVVVAHIDAKDNSPGAIDNAAGTSVLLLLAELLADYAGALGVEIVAINGEDYYAAPGEIQYLADNRGRLDEIALAINIDAAGYYQGHTAYSLYACPAEIAEAVQKVFAGREGMLAGPQWYQSDHSIFVQNQVPALALTSEHFMHLSTEITHTPKDHPDIVDGTRLARVALALRDLLLDLDTRLG